MLFYKKKISVHLWIHIVWVGDKPLTNTKLQMPFKFGTSEHFYVGLCCCREGQPAGLPQMYRTLNPLFAQDNSNSRGWVVSSLIYFICTCSLFKKEEIWQSDRFESQFSPLHITSILVMAPNVIGRGKWNRSDWTPWIYSQMVYQQSYLAIALIKLIWPPH